MALPDTGPATLEGVKAYLQITDTDDDAALSLAVAAVNVMVRGLPSAVPVTDTWPETLELGATMLAARLWRRKDSPAGVAAFGEFGPVYVQRNDPDVAMLLEVGDYARPAVG